MCYGTPKYLKKKEPWDGTPSKKGKGESQKQRGVYEIMEIDETWKEMKLFST